MGFFDFWHYWGLVWARAFWDTLGLFGADGISYVQVLAWVLPAIATGAVYIHNEGAEAMRRDYFKPLKFAAYGYGLAASVAFVLMLIRAPYALDADARERAKAAMISDSVVFQRTPHAGDIKLPSSSEPATTDAIKGVVNDAVRIQTLEGELNAAREEAKQLRAKLDGRSRRSELREQLTRFAEVGQKLDGIVRDDHSPVPRQEINKWIGDLEMFLERTLGHSYVVRSRSTQGVSLSGYSSDRPFTPERIHAMTEVDVRLFHLNHFIAEQ